MNCLCDLKSKVLCVALKWSLSCPSEAGWEVPEPRFWQCESEICYDVRWLWNVRETEEKKRMIGMLRSVSQPASNGSLENSRVWKNSGRPSCKSEKTVMGTVGKCSLKKCLTRVSCEAQKCEEGRWGSMCLMQWEENPPSSLLFLCSFVVLFWPHGIWNFNSHQGSRSRHPAMEVWILNHWTFREVLLCSFEPWCQDLSPWRCHSFLFLEHLQLENMYQLLGNPVDWPFL